MLISAFSNTGNVKINAEMPAGKAYYKCDMLTHFKVCLSKPD